MENKADILARACTAIDAGKRTEAAAIISSEYPFRHYAHASRQYNEVECMRVFVRDGFIDRYSGRRLVFPGTLRLLARLLPDVFPFQTNWKTSECHFAFYELFPTVDHRVPISRGGEDTEANLVSTSMIRNAAKANFMLDELGWSAVDPGDLRGWDGLTRWFLDQCEKRNDLTDGYFHRWADAARRTLPS